MPLHPELDAFLELINENESVPMWAMPPSDARKAYAKSTEMLDAPGADVQIEDIPWSPPDDNAVPMRIYRSRNVVEPQPVLLYFHGGGYVVGGLDSHGSLCSDLAHHAACAVLAVDYRLAPKHKFPAAFDDATSAVRWLRCHGPEYGLDTARIAYGGDSVGGTLATALCIQAKMQEHNQPILQLLLYPCTSAHQDYDSHVRYATGYLLEEQTLQWMFHHYLRTASDRTDWRFAPLEARDLSGLAPAHIVLAEFDPLLDEGLAYAARLRAAGVAATAKVHDGMIHDFARLGNVVDEVHQFRRELADVLISVFQVGS